MVIAIDLWVLNDTRMKSLCITGAYRHYFQFRATSGEKRSGRSQKLFIKFKF